MDPEIQKLVDSGKLSVSAGAALDRLKPGTYCTHKSWGFGKIADWNLLVNQIMIDFEGRKGHPMQLQYAVDSLTHIPEGHILAQRAGSPAEVRSRATADPMGTLRQIISDLGGKATADQISNTLSGSVFNPNELKRWWENARKLLKKEPAIAVPAKKTEPYTLRDANTSRSETLLSPFFAARQLKDQLLAAESILKNFEEFEDPAAQLMPVVTALDDSAQKNQRLKVSESIELLLARDEICAKSPDLQCPEGGLQLSQLIVAEESRLPAVLGSLPAAKLRRVTNEIPNALGERWTSRAFTILQQANHKVVVELIRVLIEAGRKAELHQFLHRSIHDHSISPETLLWLCKEREGMFNELVQPNLLGAIVEALERDQHGEIKRGSKLHDLLMDDRELLTDILATADRQALRDAMRKMLLTPVFEELNKRSLLARIIKMHPDLQSMMTGDQGEKQETLVVSWTSLDRRQKEYEELVNKKIPENSREIGIAREYGDLRENFEFKAAKQMQAVLMRQKAELDYDLSRARGTDFDNADTSVVSIGTVVRLRDVKDNQEMTYTILGAWDGNPEKNTLNYLANLAQALIGHRVGEAVTLPSEEERTYEILEISAVNPTDYQVPHTEEPAEAQKESETPAEVGAAAEQQ